MNYQNRRPQANRIRRKKRSTAKPIVVAAVLIAILLIAVIVIVAVSQSNRKPGSEPVILPVDTGGSSTETEPVIEPLTYKEITLLSAGDVMYHSPQLDEAYDWNTGEYDFSPTYQFVKPLVSSADYAVANFEATTAGDAFAYSGYPSFNTPDTGMTVLKDAGFDMLLFANNHCYDTSTTGLERTQENFTKYGFDYVGARPDTTGKTFKAVDIKGVKVGFLNSTDDIAYGATEPRSINGIPIAPSDLVRMDVFNLSLLDEFYSRTGAAIAEMKSQGADLIVMYIHWGIEYQLVHNEDQAAIAQKLCDLGVDVIIGGHPHVVQDAEVLTSSEDPSHKTLCFYSLGNYVSNQNRLTMGDLANSEYTENGLTVILTIRKYSNGETMVTKVETVPTWVHRYTDSTTWKNYHVIVPLPQAVADPAAYGLTLSDFGTSHAQAALAMTDGQIAGITEAFAKTVILPAEN